MYFVSVRSGIPSEKRGQWSSDWIERLATRARDDCAAEGTSHSWDISRRFQCLVHEELPGFNYKWHDDARNIRLVCTLLLLPRLL